ncbi:DUF2272 domain-containing protein [Mesorhizobium sp. ISC15]|uniref:DUF2272 domain-containing protein n=1 Tax=Mesorhizobium sp. ISC15 TaxID=3076429 RepID=UPI00301BBED6
MPTTYAAKIASLAEADFDQFHGFNETTTRMSNRIRKYWTEVGLHFPGVGTPWSAVFVSFFVKSSGATASEFHFAAAHARFVFVAIRNAQNNVGVFRGRRLNQYAPKIGDIIQNNRGGNTFDFDHAAAHNDYESHSAIVVEEGIDGNGRYVRTIGGNEADSVGDKIVRLSARGLIRQPSTDPHRYMCVIENLK